MEPLTERQQQILDYIVARQQTGGETPTFQDVAEHFGFRVNAAWEHIQSLRRKGYLEGRPGKARGLRVISPLSRFRGQVVDIPLYGSIPAGFADDRQQEASGCISVDVHTLGIKPGKRTFALQVTGDSMIGRHIVEGDYVILEHGKQPRSGDVVAALIDNESTLKTFVLEKGKPFLRAENPRYPQLIPATELVIQGVMVALIRKG
jgi:repressor LexA